jgi:hypothetical protein
MVAVECHVAFKDPSFTFCALGMRLFFKPQGSSYVPVYTGVNF